MRISRKLNAMLRPLGLILSLLMVLASVQISLAQAPGDGQGARPKPPFQIKPDTRVEQRKYHFQETNEEITYVLYVSSKVSKDKKNPLIVALHGLGGDGKFSRNN